ncbi:MAG: WGR domain-containing protein [Cytophagales bacterium]|nr:WGR domain-containing protein [Cytophagales bacterium]
MLPSVYLHYREGTSDKVYQASIEEQDTGYVVNFAFGRRGTTLQTGTKTQVPVPLEAAQKIFDKLVKEKTAKGYLPYQDGTAYQHATHTDKEQRNTGVFCQLLNPIEADEVPKYIADDRFLAQEKHDGKRLIVSKKGNELTAINRKGLSVGFPASFEALKNHAIDFTLDGEAVGDCLFVFDLLELDDQNLRQEPLLNRLQKLDELLAQLNAKCLAKTASAHDTAGKQALFDRLHSQRKEGIVFKLKTSAYTAGRPNSGGNHLKHKFYATASFQVLAVNGKRSVALGLHENGKWVGAGNVTISINFEIPQAGDIVEVRYLYAFRESGSVYQPVYLGKRDDIDANDCVVGQLKYKAEQED